MLSGRRAVTRIDALQRCDEVREVGRQPVEVVDALGYRRLAGQPAVDGPCERVALGRLAHAAHDRDRQRQRSLKARQPLQLLVLTPCPAREARQSHGEGVAEPEGDVVGARLGDASERQVRPLGKLPSQQPLHERYVDRDLVGVHLHVPIMTR